MSVDTDNKKIQELLTRGVENIYPSKEFLEERLKSGEQLSLYTGYDPTAASLHIGHGITLLKLRLFQELGHKVIMLIGDFTGVIGDPTDKSSMRQQLSKEQVAENCQEYKKQAEAVLNFTGDNPVELRYNSEWLAKMNLGDFLELAAKVTVPRLIERDMFQLRLQEGKTFHLHELLYPVLQGYDSVAMDIDGEVGGNDQTFNMLVGRDLLKEMQHKEKFVLTSKLLADTSGVKMGKTEGNMIALDDSPEDMFGKVMSWADDMIVSGFELCTRVAMSEIAVIDKKMKAGDNPRDFKLQLAYEITKTFLGEEAAEKGKENFATVIQSKDKPETISEITPSDYDVVTVLVEAKICSSNGDARRQIEQGGVKINDVKVEEIKQQTKAGDIIQKGKRFFVKVK